MLVGHQLQQQVHRRVVLVVALQWNAWRIFSSQSEAGLWARGLVGYGSLSLSAYALPVLIVPSHDGPPFTMLEKKC